MKNKKIKPFCYLKLFLPVLFILLSFSLSYSQSGWFSQPLPVTGQVYDLKFFDAYTGLVAMWQTTVVLRTTNGGYNWSIVLSNQGIGEFELIDSTTIFARGSGYATDVFLFRSYNKGLTWDSLPVANAWTGNGISFVNRDTGWIGGTAGALPFLWRTTNGGLNWTVQSDNTGQGKVFFLKYKVNGEYIGWSQEESIATYKTTNSGATWFQIENIGNTSQIYFKDSNTGWAACGNNMKKTTNGGLNWVIHYMPTNYNITTNYITLYKNINNDTIYGEGGNRDFGLFVRGIIWISTNGGVNWNFQQPDTSIQVGKYHGIDFINNNTGWSSHIRTNDGGGPIIITGINKQIATKPEQYTLEQNFPNPFNPSTRINYSVSKPSYITLSVYDITGKEVLKIYNNELFTAGNYFAVIDAGKMNLTSGVYVYKMTATGLDGGNVYTQTKKMVYVK